MSWDINNSLMRTNLLHFLPWHRLLVFLKNTLMYNYHDSLLQNVLLPRLISIMVLLKLVGLMRRIRNIGNAFKREICC